MPAKKHVFNSLNQKSLFNKFITIFLHPIPTTESKHIAQTKFARENGIILELKQGSYSVSENITTRNLPVMSISAYDS